MARLQGRDGAFEWRNFFVITASALSLLGVALGIWFAVHSSLFVLRVVEVADLPDSAPIDAQAITDLVDLPLGKWNLFLIDLSPIEKRVLAHPWIRGVTLQKRFPQTLTVSVVFREPRALLQAEHGRLAYIDKDGQVFGQVSLSRQPDLPLVSGLASRQQDKIGEALQLLEKWEKSRLGRISQVSSLEFEGERGYRAWVTYPLPATAKGAALGRGRALVELGQEVDPELDGQLDRLQSVFRYLSGNGIAARQIWADAGKKIVVRVTRGS